MNPDPGDPFFGAGIAERHSTAVHLGLRHRPGRDTHGNSFNACARDFNLRLFGDRRIPIHARQCQTELEPFEVVVGGCRKVDANGVLGGTC